MDPRATAKNWQTGEISQDSSSKKNLKYEVSASTVFSWGLRSLRCLETVSSTFQDLEFDGSLQPLYTC